jgi:hypothetical protein
MNCEFFDRMLGKCPNPADLQVTIDAGLGLIVTYGFCNRCAREYDLPGFKIIETGPLPEHKVKLLEAEISDLKTKLHQARLDLAKMTNERGLADADRKEWVKTAQCLGAQLEGSEAQCEKTGIALNDALKRLAAYQEGVQELNNALPKSLTPALFNRLMNLLDLGSEGFDE